MILPRIIPCLLLNGNRLVKTVRFSRPVYIGDPINAVKIFNEKEVDELALFDIEAPRKKTPPKFDLIAEIVSESFMPLCYGGGISNLDQVERLFKIGIEKVSFNSALYDNPTLIADAAKRFGSQSIIVSVDVRRTLFGRYAAFVQAGKLRVKQPLTEFIKRCEDLGAGEIFLNAIDRDGVMGGYDIELIRAASHIVQVPLVACGGAGKLADFGAAVSAGASAAAAGSFFIFEGVHKAVLITYPSQQQIRSIFSAQEN